jgi:hypothetical protein
MEPFWKTPGVGHLKNFENTAFCSWVTVFMLALIDFSNPGEFCCYPIKLCSNEFRGKNSPDCTCCTLVCLNISFLASSSISMVACWSLEIVLGSRSSQILPSLVWFTASVIKILTCNDSLVHSLRRDMSILFRACCIFPKPSGAHRFPLSWIAVLGKRESVRQHLGSLWLSFFATCYLRYFFGVVGCRSLEPYVLYPLISRHHSTSFSDTVCFVRSSRSELKKPV